MNFEPVPIIAEATPLTASSYLAPTMHMCAMVTFLPLRLLTCRHDREQTSLLDSLEARWLAPAPAQQASRKVQCFRTNRSIIRL